MERDILGGAAIVGMGLEQTVEKGHSSSGNCFQGVELSLLCHRSFGEPQGTRATIDQAPNRGAAIQTRMSPAEKPRPTPPWPGVGVNSLLLFLFSFPENGHFSPKAHLFSSPPTSRLTASCRLTTTNTSIPATVSEMPCDPDPALMADIQADLARHAKTLATERVKRELLHIAQKTRDEVRSRIERFVYRTDILDATLRTYLSQDDANEAMGGLRSEALKIVWEAVEGTFLETALHAGSQGRGLAGSSAPTPPTEASSSSSESSEPSEPPAQRLIQEAPSSSHVASTSHAAPTYRAASTYRAPSTFPESPDQTLVGEVELEEVAAPIVGSYQPRNLESSNQIRFQRSPVCIAARPSMDHELTSVFARPNAAEPYPTPMGHTRPRNPGTRRRCSKSSIWKSYQAAVLPQGGRRGSL